MTDTGETPASVTTPRGRHAPDVALYRGEPAVTYLADALWDCWAHTGADLDGDTGPGAIIAGMGLRGFAEVVVEAVRELRCDYQEALDVSPIG